MCMWFSVSFGSFTELWKTSRGACFELQHFKEEDYFHRVIKAKIFAEIVQKLKKQYMRNCKISMELIGVIKF